MRAMLVCVVTALLAMTAPAGAEAPRRVALVVGNETYKSLTSLGNPRLDAGRVAALLDANGFDVVRCDGQHPGCFDLDHDGLEDALETFRKKADGADLALVFYAGHGMEGRGGNVLAPVDMEVSDCAKRALSNAVPLNALFKAMADAHSKIVILDACRNDPFAQCPPQRGIRPVSFGELTVPEAESYLLVSSTKPGQEAQDGPTGAHSPYAQALLEWLEKTPELYFPQVLSYVAKEVIEDTARSDRSATQVPEMLQRGEAPGSCLKGEDCVGDVRFAALSQELEGLRKEHARDQEAKAIADDYLAAAEKARAGRPLTEEEKREQLQGLKEVSKGISDFLLEAATGRGRPFSPEDEAQERARLMEAIRALPALGDTRAERALERLNAGDEGEAERLFAEAAAARKQAAQTAASRAAEENREAAKALRHVAAIAKPKNVVKAADTYKEAAHLDPADAQTWIEYARTARDAGRTAEARAAFEQADINARASGDLLVRRRAALGLGQVLQAQSDLAGALASYREALAMDDRRVASDPANLEFQLDRAFVHWLIAGALKKGHDLPGALASYRDAIAGYEKADSSRTLLQSGLSLAHANAGLILEEQGDQAGALVSYRASLSVAERLVRIDPANDTYQGYIALTHRMIGSLLQKQGNPTDALASYRAALAIDEERLKSKPGDTVATLESLRSAHYNIGHILHLKGDLAGALASFQAVLAANERLARVDAGNSDRQLAIWGSHIVIGEVLQDQGRLADALTHYAAAQDIAEGRFKVDPGSSVWARNLAWSYRDVAGVRLAKGDRASAFPLWRKALAIVEESAVAIETEETKGAGKPGAKTADALREVGWNALIARDTSKAAAAVERWSTLATDRWPDVGRAHVLMFGNHLSEARALYLKGKGTLVNDRAWEQVIANDFHALRRAGLARPMMREVEVALGIASAQVSRSADDAAHRAAGRATQPTVPATSPTPTHAKKKVTTPDWRTNSWGQ